MYSPSRLPPSFGLWTAISVVIGSIIGSGIFMKPATMAGQLGSPELLLVVWVGAGIITLFGALANAEIAAMIPETGGQYVFFRKMYGGFFAYLYGWSAFAVFNTAGVASIAYVMSTYGGYFIPLPELPEAAERAVDLYLPFIGHIYPLENIGLKCLTVLIIFILTWISYRSTKTGGRLLVVFTFLKIIAIGLVILMLLFSGKGDAANFVRDAPGLELKGWALAGAVMAAVSGAFWAYDGWNNITFVAGEMQHPQRDIPRALALGILSCILIYALVNMAFLYVIPVEEMAGSSMIASDAARVVLGSAGGGIIALLVILSTLGATHGNIISTTRATFSMANTGHFFRRMGEVHPRFGTPGNALWLHAAWGSALVFSGSFDMLTDMLIFVSWLFYGMSAFGLFVLRRKMRDAHRPYKVWGYPLVPAVFVVFAVFFLGVTVYTDISAYIHGRSALIHSAMGICLVGMGVPLYFYFRKNE